jgi:hypothetical protein
VQPHTLSLLSCSFTDAVHHWDENGLANPLDEPEDIRRIHDETIMFVTEWLKDFMTPASK